MRWENLFRDLEHQLDQELEYAQSDVARDRSRYESAQREWVAEVRGLLRHQLAEPKRCHLGELSLWIAVDNSGKDWVSGTVTAPRAHVGYVILNLGAVDRVYSDVAQERADSANRAMPDPEHSPRLSLAEKITLRIVLRDISRRRKSVALITAHALMHGTIDEVGADYLVIAEHGLHESRRRTGVKNQVFVRLSTILWVRLDD